VTKVLLVGMMGAGKTTVGRMVAERLGCPYADSDAEVEAATGRTVPELFAEHGEAVFRAAEAEALARAVGVDGPAVISVAGGAVLDPANRALIKEAGTVVWLRADPATLAGRVGDGAGRPLLADDPAAELARLETVRRPYYAEVADAAVDVDGSTPEAVADAVLAALG
jgi:shikimate kinase